MQSQPFIIYALPRSRTAWLSTFLTYRDWTCYHERAIYMRDVDDIGDFFAEPNTGSVETGAAQGWWLLNHHVPNIKSVVIRRDPSEVIESALCLNIGDIATYDQAALRRNMEYGARMLDQISAIPGTLTIDYADLKKRDACAAIFERCLPYKFDAGWWGKLRSVNIQADVREMFRYYLSHRTQIDAFKRACKAELMHLARAGHLHQGTA